MGPPWSVYAENYLAIWAYIRAVSWAYPGGVTLTSWYRSPEQNRRVGGHPNSKHMRALATDWVGDLGRLTYFAQRAQAAGLTPVMEGDHLHIQA